MRRVCSLEELDRPLEVRLRVVWSQPRRRHHSGTLLELGLYEQIVSETGRALECALGLEIRAERRCPVARAHEHLVRFSADLFGISVDGRGLIGIEIVRSYDLDDLVFFAAPGRRQESSSGEVLRFPVLLRDRVVRDTPDDVLEERVLPAFRRPRISLDRQHLFAQERFEQRLQLALG